MQGCSAGKEEIALGKNPKNKGGSPPLKRKFGMTLKI